MAKKRVLVLGCTGSIGSQTLDIIRNEKDLFECAGISAGKNIAKVENLCKEFNCPGTVFSRDGIEGLKQLINSSKPDIAVNGVAGSAGLLPSILCLENKIDLALANKETVVMAWDYVKNLALSKGASIIPVDSEHSAIFNLTQNFGMEKLSQIVITASGGPFREYTKEMLKTVTVEQALKHPTWNMGGKITIDSASLANKGLEVIEAVRLFNMNPDNVQVVVHPQSLIHSLVRTKDGMLYAQISNPSMKHPIFGALVWPEYKENYMEQFDLFGSTMTFFKPDTELFPMLKIAYECARKSNCYTVAYNAANEVAVQAFFDKKINFIQIPELVEKTLQKDFSLFPKDLETILEMDKCARNTAENLLCQL